MTKENYKGCPTYYGGEKVDNGEIIDLVTFSQMHNLGFLETDIIKRIMRLGKKGGRQGAADDIAKIQYSLERLFAPFKLADSDRIDALAIESLHKTKPKIDTYLEDNLLNAKEVVK